MVLYTCKLRRKGAGWHPCGVACRALDEAGQEYELRTVRGYASAPWTWLTRRRDRALIRAMSGRNGVPVLVLDDGEVIAGSERIKRWAATSSVDDRGAERVPERPERRRRSNLRSDLQ